MKSAKPPFRGYLVLSTNPPIIYMMDHLLRTRRNMMGLLLESLRRRHVSLVIALSWCYRNPHQIKWLAERVAYLQSRAPDHRFIILTNTTEEADLIRQAGLETVFCHQNVFLNEDLYYPMETAKKYDAIYDAALAPFKRHELARGIENLALISYVKSDVALHDTMRIADENRHAIWLNDPIDNPSSWLNETAVNHFLNQAKVGLCLSAVEGAMYASAQYLLAGLPVVTTQNTGGRDTLLDPAYTRWVEDDPHAVAAAAQELIELNIDPAFIRQETLKRFSTHRRVFLDLLNKIVREKTGGLWANKWPSDLPSRLFSDRIPFYKSFLSLHIQNSPAPWTLR